MNIKIDNQLVQVYYQEALENAARSRAERNAQPIRAKIKGQWILIPLAAAGIPVVIWLIQSFKAG